MRVLLIVMCLALVSLACERTGKQITEKIKEGMEDPDNCDLTEQLIITTKIDQEESRPDGSYRCDYTVTISNSNPDTNADVMVKTHTQRGCYEVNDETEWENWGGWGVFAISPFGDYTISVDKDCLGDGISLTMPEKVAMIRMADECKKIKDDEKYLEIFAQDIDYPCKYPIDGE